MTNFITDSIEANVEMAQNQIEERLDNIEANVELTQSQVEDGFSQLRSIDVDQVIEANCCWGPSWS